MNRMSKIFYQAAACFLVCQLLWLGFLIATTHSGWDTVWLSVSEIPSCRSFRSSHAISEINIAPDRTVERINELLDENPDSAPLHAGAAYFLKRLPATAALIRGEAHPSVKVARRATEIDPSDKNIWRLRALLIMEKSATPSRGDQWTVDEGILAELKECRENDADNGLYDYLSALHCWRHGLILLATNSARGSVLRDKNNDAAERGNQFANAGAKHDVVSLCVGLNEDILSFLNELDVPKPGQLDVVQKPNQAQAFAWFVNDMRRYQVRNGSNRIIRGNLTGVRESRRFLNQALNGKGFKLTDVTSQRMEVLRELSRAKPYDSELDEPAKSSRIDYQACVTTDINPIRPSFLDDLDRYQKMFNQPKVDNSRPFDVYWASRFQQPKPQKNAKSIQPRRRWAAVTRLLGLIVLLLIALTIGSYVWLRKVGPSAKPDHLSWQLHVVVWIWAVFGTYVSSHESELSTIDAKLFAAGAFIFGLLIVMWFRANSYQFRDVARFLPRPVLRSAMPMLCVFGIIYLASLTSLVRRVDLEYEALLANAQKPVMTGHEEIAAARKATHFNTTE